MEVLKAIGKFLVKEINVRELSYKAYKEVLMPYLEKKVASTESAWDDIMLKGVNQLVEVFLKPKAEAKPNA